MVLPGPRTRQLGPVLAIEAVTPEDGGVYRCTASNAGGEASAELRLIVSTTMHVEITPPLLSIHMGGSAEFRCMVSSQGGGPHLVTWYKDGRQLPSSGRGQSEMLVINNVGREDRGMYQCIVRRSEGDTAQASAELQLGGKRHRFIYKFCMYSYVYIMSVCVLACIHYVYILIFINLYNISKLFTVTCSRQVYFLIFICFFQNPELN